MQHRLLVLSMSLQETCTEVVLWSSRLNVGANSSGRRTVTILSPYGADCMFHTKLRYQSTNLYCVTTQKASTWIFTDVKIWDLPQSSERPSYVSMDEWFSIPCNSLPAAHVFISKSKFLRFGTARVITVITGNSYFLDSHALCSQRVRSFDKHYIRQCTHHNITITILHSIHRQLDSIGLSIPHRKHITSPLRSQQFNAIYRFVTMVY
jgi:hypothetical protein